MADFEPFKLFNREQETDTVPEKYSTISVQELQNIGIGLQATVIDFGLNQHELTAKNTEEWYKL